MKRVAFRATKILSIAAFGSIKNLRTVKVDFLDVSRIVLEFLFEENVIIFRFLKKGNQELLFSEIIKRT